MLLEKVSSLDNYKGGEDFMELFGNTVVVKGKHRTRYEYRRVCHSPRATGPGSSRCLQEGILRTEHQLVMESREYSGSSLLDLTSLIYLIITRHTAL